MRYFIRLLLILTFSVGLFGCSEKIKPEDRFSEYIEKWNQQDFSAMYDMLTAETKNKVSRAEFVERYKKIYEDINAQNVKVEFVKPEEEVKPNEDGNVLFTYSFSMDTLAGPVSFNHNATLVEEELEEGKDWRIQWNTNMIFPQLNDGEEITIQSIIPERGGIFDRNGSPLAINGELWEIGIVPGKMGEKRDEIIQQFSDISGMSVEEFEKKLSQSWVTDNSFVPIITVDPILHGQLKDSLLTIPSVLKKDSTGRKYPLGESAAHLIGYLRSMYQEEVKDYQEKGYSMYEKIGAKGLESVFEERLHGETGWVIKVKGTDKVIAEKPPVKGEDIYLTIDATLQQLLFNQLKDEAGTSVALNPTTGETLALVSSPSYDPNLYSLEYVKKKDDPNHPFMARFNNTYSPGSTLKPLTAAIALENKVINANDIRKISGSTWNKPSFGGYTVTRVNTNITEVDVTKALVYSDNIYFAQVALETGTKNFQNGLKSFGFEEEVEYPFPIETSSISNNGINGEVLLADSGYGQGEIQMSPLHLAATYSTFVNNGNMIKPVLEKKENMTPTYWREKVISSENSQIITNALKQVVEVGTAKPPIQGINLAGKTGTAELKTSKDDKGKENGWFIAYDLNKKDLLITMMVENVENREGSKVAVEKVKSVFSQFIR